MAALAIAMLAITFEPGGGDDPDVETASPTDGVASTASTTSPATDAAPSSSEPEEPAATVPPDASAPVDGSLSESVRRGSGQPVTFAFGGDTHFETYLRTQLDADPAGMLEPIAPILTAADVAVVNLETAVTDRGEPAAKDFTFRAPASALTALASAGVDVPSLANNHGLDYGAIGIEDALAASRETGVAVIGIGEDAASAYRPWTASIKGQRIAVIGATQVLDSEFISSWTATDSQGGLASAKEVDRLLAAVVMARAEADTLVVFLHWGISEQACPSAAQQELAAQLAVAGADIIVGAHAHQLQGAGYLGETFVAYGLGNFIWYSQPGVSSETGVLTVTAVGRDVEEFSFTPALISNGVPAPVEGDAAGDRLDEWNALRDCTDLSEQREPSRGAVP